MLITQTDIFAFPDTLLKEWRLACFEGNDIPDKTMLEEKEQKEDDEGKKEAKDMEEQKEGDTEDALEQEVAELLEAQEQRAEGAEAALAAERSKVEKAEQAADVIEMDIAGDFEEEIVTDQEAAVDGTQQAANLGVRVEVIGEPLTPNEEEQFSSSGPDASTTEESDAEIDAADVVPARPAGGEKEPEEDRPVVIENRKKEDSPDT